MDLIESSRSQWFEVATQFRAIFLSVDVGGAGAGGTAAGRNSPLSSPGGANRKVAAALAGGGRDRYSTSQRTCRLGFVLSLLFFCVTTPQIFVALHPIPDFPSFFFPACWPYFSVSEHAFALLKNTLG